MKQKDFAYKIGVSPSQVSEWLKDKATPNYHTLKRICLAFNISADYFLGITDGY
ncbi:MAG: helix-turn-helix transcriptional regulator [Clostridia bacterium]|nr:helix-turn-helix transcriptional regulator [Clostridia bacterium]